MDFAGLANSSLHDRLARYFSELEQTFARLPSPEGTCADRRLKLAGKTIRLRIAGTALGRVLGPALEHLANEAETATSDLEICCWDGAETGVALPPPPWSAATGIGRTIFPAGGEQFRVSDSSGGETFALLRLDQGRGIFWTRDARRLPTFHHAAPLVEVFQAWGRTAGLTVLHAGCVGDERGGVLLGGRGGAGKSTTALLGLEAGLRYASDDFCLLESGEPPTVHCLFASAKLHRVDLPLFPRLAALAEDPVPDVFDKPVMFLRRAFAAQVVTQLPLRAVVLPRVAAQERSEFARISPAQALREFAPSTLFQLPGEGAAPLQAMAALVRGLPCFRLTLGRRETVAAALRGILDEVA